MKIGSLLRRIPLKSRLASIAATRPRRAWRKLHIGIDAGNGEIVAFDLTDKDVDDAFHVPTLLDQLTQDPASFMADGAYDRAATYDAILARNPSARFIVPPCKGSVPGPTATISPTLRAICGRP